MNRIPNSASSAFPVIRDIIGMGWMEVPDKFKGNGAPGNTLEYLLDVETNNHDLPDLNDWEVKFHGGNALLTLFHKEPSPRGIMNQMVDKFGWQDDKNRISFRHTIRSKSNRGFEVVDEDNKIKIKNHTISEVEPYWSYNTILGSFGAKLRRLILVNGNYDAKSRKVKYEKATAYWDLDLISICTAIENGIIQIDFDARTKQGRGTTLRNHGTKFRIKVNDVGSLYLNSQEII